MSKMTNTAGAIIFGIGSMFPSNAKADSTEVNTPSQPFDPNALWNQIDQSSKEAPVDSTHYSEALHKEIITASDALSNIKDTYQELVVKHPALVGQLHPDYFKQVYGNFENHLNSLRAEAAAGFEDASLENAELFSTRLHSYSDMLQVYAEYSEVREELWKFAAEKEPLASSLMTAADEAFQQGNPVELHAAIHSLLEKYESHQDKQDRQGRLIVSVAVGGTVGLINALLMAAHRSR